MLNIIILMGRLVADPELKQTPGGVSVSTFRLAVERDYAGQDKQRQSDFINCVAWRQTGEFISRYFTKGRMIAIEGSLQTRKYEDKSGNKHTVYEVMAEHAYFADTTPSTASAEGTFQSKQESYPGIRQNLSQNAIERNNKGKTGRRSFDSFESDYDDLDLPY